MKLFYKIASYSLELGLIHTALTPLFYDHLSTAALWFAGTGLALVFLGLLNLAAGRVWQAWLLNICIAANLVTAIYCAVIVTVLPEFQAYLALLFILAVFVASIGSRLKIKSTPEPVFSPTHLSE
jgi:sulfite exporter TauE/SafE